MDPVKVLLLKSNNSIRDNKPISGGMLPVNKLLDTSKTSKYGVLPNPTGIVPRSAGVRQMS
eukprot:13664264-Ditylum_brightwellii.AAC.1